MFLMAVILPSAERGPGSNRHRMLNNALARSGIWSVPAWAATDPAARVDRPASSHGGRRADSRAHPPGPSARANRRKHPGKFGNAPNLPKLLNHAERFRLCRRLPLRDRNYLDSGFYQIEAVNALDAGRSMILWRYSQESFIRLSHSAYSTCEPDRDSRRVFAGQPCAGRTEGNGLVDLSTPLKGDSERLSAGRLLIGVATQWQRAALALT